MAKEAAPKRTLDAHERESLKARAAQGRSMLHASKEFPDGGAGVVVPVEVALGQDKIQEDVRHAESILERDSPRRETNEAKRNKIVSRRKELESKFKPYLETRQDLDVTRRDTPEFRQALRKAQMRPTVEHYIAEWRELGKQLDPEDPTLCSLDEIRDAR